MDWILVESSHIHSWKWEARGYQYGTLHVRYLRKGTSFPQTQYRYDAVPLEVWGMLQRAESKGVALNLLIKSVGQVFHKEDLELSPQEIKEILPSIMEEFLSWTHPYQRTLRSWYDSLQTFFTMKRETCNTK